MSEIKFTLKKIIYLLVSIFIKFPEVEQTDVTLNKIIKEKCSVTRYGDGELDLITLKRNIGFQEINKELSYRLEEILKSQSPNLLVCIPDVFNGLGKYIKPTRNIWMSFVIGNFQQWSKLLDRNIIYYNAFISRPYYIYKDKNNTENIFLKWKEVWENRNVLIVEGKQSRLGVGNDLFDNAKSITRVICPSENAFLKYDEIFNEIIKNERDRLVLIALGPTSTVLSYDLHHMGYQAIDIGHLDLEYEWFRRKVTTKVKIGYKYTNEVEDGNIVEEIKNSEYENQIVKKI